jgi:hypothetical protein
MATLLTNFAYSTLAFSITTGDTTLTVASGHGARFPAISGGNIFYLVLEDSSLNREIVKVTARSTDAMTIVRAQEGTAARAFTAGVSVALRITAQTIADLLAAITNATNLIGSGTISATTTGGAALSVASAISANSSTTQSVKDSTTAIATTAFVDRLRSLLSSAVTSGALSVTDRGCLVSATAGVTIPVSIFAANDVVTIYNNSAGNITLTQDTGLTMYWAGIGSTGNRTLAQRGIATVVFINGTTCAISGAGVS